LLALIQPKLQRWSPSTQISIDCGCLFCRALTGNWSALFASVGTIGLTYAPQVLAHRLNVQIPLLFELIITIFLYASISWARLEIITKNSGGGILFCTSGRRLLSVLQDFWCYTCYSCRTRSKPVPFLVAVFSFTFGLAIGAMWEIFEFMVDSLFGTNMQKSGLRDTMGDLIVDAFGAGLVRDRLRLFAFQIKDPFDALINLFLQANPRFKSRFPGRLRR